MTSLPERYLSKAHYLISENCNKIWEKYKIRNSSTGTKGISYCTVERLIKARISPRVDNNFPILQKL
jgi:hypothetical protein